MDLHPRSASIEDASRLLPVVKARLTPAELGRSLLSLMIAATRPSISHCWTGSSVEGQIGGWMRAGPIIGRKVWFGPRRDGLGWGWRSVSWEGHLTFVLFLLTVLGYPVAVGGERAGVVTAGAVVGLIGIALLKGSTPGGRKQAEEFDRLRS